MSVDKAQHQVQMYKRMVTNMYIFLIFVKEISSLQFLLIALILLYYKST